MIAWLLVVALGWAAPPLDLNAATAEQLALLPGLGPAKAASIVTWRVENGPFPSLDALTAVPHIGPGTVANLRGRLAVAEPGDAPVPPPPDRVDINRADRAALSTLPGVGPDEADQIIARRPFASCADLEALPGFGPATVANLADRCIASTPRAR